MIHRGEIVKKRIAESGFDLTDVYRKYPKAKNTFTSWLEKENLSYDKILRIGQIIGYDFSQDFPILKTMTFNAAEGIFIFNEPPATYTPAEKAAFEQYVKQSLEELKTLLEELIGLSKPENPTANPQNPS